MPNAAKSLSRLRDRILSLYDYGKENALVNWAVDCNELAFLTDKKDVSIGEFRRCTPCITEAQLDLIRSELLREEAVWYSRRDAHVGLSPFLSLTAILVAVLALVSQILPQDAASSCLPEFCFVVVLVMLAVWLFERHWFSAAKKRGLISRIIKLRNRIDIYLLSVRGEGVGVDASATAESAEKTRSDTECGFS